MIHVDSVDFFMGLHSWGGSEYQGDGISSWKFWFFSTSFFVLSAYHHPDMVNSTSVDEKIKLKDFRNSRSADMISPCFFVYPDYP